MEFTAIGLKALCISLYIFNVLPLTSFLTFCLLQQSARNVFALGNVTPPTGIAHKIGLWHKSFKKTNQSRYNPNCVITKNNLPPEYKAVFLRFMGIQLDPELIRPEMYNKLHPELAAVFGVLYPNGVFQAAPPLNDKKVATDHQSQPKKLPPNLLPTKVSQLVKVGFPEHFIFMVRKNQYTTAKQHLKNITTFELTLQLGNAFRLKVNLNPQLIYSLLCWAIIFWGIPTTPLALGANIGILKTLCSPLFWFVQQAPVFILSHCLMFFLTAFSIRKQDAIMLFLGHDPKSPSSHLMCLHKESYDTQRTSESVLVYSLGTILVNILVNAFLFFALHCLAITPVNIISFIGPWTLLGLSILTACDRLYFLAQQNFKFGLKPNIIFCSTLSDATLDATVSDSERQSFASTQGIEVPPKISKYINTVHRAAYKVCHAL